MSPGMRLAMQILIILGPWCACAVLAMWMSRLAGEVSALRHAKATPGQVQVNANELLRILSEKEYGDLMKKSAEERQESQPPPA